MLTRRQFSTYILGAGSMLLASRNLWPFQRPSSQQPASDYDLLIKGGTVVDPSQNLHERLDVAVKNFKIVQLSGDIPENSARQVISAKGRFVTPGLINLHSHVFDG